VPAGVVAAAQRRDGRPGVMAGALVGISIPNFLLGLL